MREDGLCICEISVVMRGSREFKTKIPEFGHYIFSASFTLSYQLPFVSERWAKPNGLNMEDATETRRQKGLVNPRFLKGAFSRSTLIVSCTIHDMKPKSKIMGVLFSLE